MLSWVSVITRCVGEDRGIPAAEQGYIQTTASSGVFWHLIPMDSCSCVT